MAAPSLDNLVRTEAPGAEAENLARQKLGEVLELYGRTICDEPQRCEALLRDLCGGHRRDIFLLVAALKERVVPDILASLGILPENVIVSNLTRKLCDNLGLAEDASRWAAESWVLLIRDAPAKGKIRKPPAQPPRVFPDSDACTGRADSPVMDSRPLGGIDWVWMGLCFLAMISCGVALVAVERVASYHNWISFRDWLGETGFLAGGLALGWAGEWVAARHFLRRDAPHPSALDPRKTPAALLVEVFVLLTQPLVPVGILALWVGEWIGGLHGIGQSHELAFNFGRLIQSALIGVFVFKWVGLMTTIQGRIASSMVRQR